MKRLMILLALFTGSSASAGQVLLPAPLSDLLPAGSFAKNVYTFSDFSYSTSPVGIPPTAADVTVDAFNGGPEHGIKFSGAFATISGFADFTIDYTVTAPAGSLITDANLIATWNVLGGTGSGSIAETILNHATGKVIGVLNLISPDPGAVTLNFAGVQAIDIEKDVILSGGDKGIAVSIIDQGFSSVPEPASLSLLGMGLIGFCVLRRAIKAGFFPKQW